MNKKTLYFVASILYCSSIQAQEVPVPNAKDFLPGPPDEKTETVPYINDYLQYEWGKTERDTELGEQAKIDFLDSQLSRCFLESCRYRTVCQEHPQHLYVV